MMEGAEESMATASTTIEQKALGTEGETLVISLPSFAPDAGASMLHSIAAAFGGLNVVVATTDASVHPLNVDPPDHTPLKVVTYTPAVPPTSSWTLNAADYINSYELVRTNGAKAILVLGAEAQSLHPAALRKLADEAMSNACDLVVPRYALPARAGLVNSAILYPISRALFGAAPRFPLAIDLCLTSRMAERLAMIAQRLTAANQADGLVWPVSEAATAGYRIGQIEAGSRTLPPPPVSDLNAVLALVTGSLFADVDAKAAFWQRARVAQVTPSTSSSSPSADASQTEIQSMIDGFRLAYGNLLEIWSLVLPPQSLLGLKRLSVMPAESFSMPDSLWARVVYDFLLAYRLRTLSRSHLLGALTPLYLAWVASYLTGVDAGKDPEVRIEAVANAFEADKPYLVSRWRWPDRFNP
jgi:hypothetical protein